MSRIVIFILAFLVWSCDTSESVAPRYSDFFVKIIGVEGDQFGNDVIQVSDGGYVIVGKTEAVAGEEPQFLVIKTDSLGNSEWIFPNGLNQNVQGEAVSVVESNGTYIVGGTQGVGDDRRSKIIIVDAAGNLGENHVVETIDPGTGELLYNTLSKLTIGQSGSVLVSGETNLLRNPDNKENLNGYIRLLNPGSLQPLLFPGGLDIKLFGGSSEDHISGAFETNFGPSHKYIVLGHSNELLGNPGSIFNYYYTIFDESTEISLGPVQISEVGDQAANGVAEFNDKYYMVGTSDNSSNYVQISRIEISVTNGFIDYNRDFSNNYPFDGDSFGRSIDIAPDGNQVFTADHGFIDSSDEIIRSTDIGLHHVRLDLNDWSRRFGEVGRNYAKSVIVDRAGSIVSTGTVRLESQSKVVLIKTGSNGEMSF